MIASDLLSPDVNLSRLLKCNCLSVRSDKSALVDYLELRGVVAQW